MNGTAGAAGRRALLAGALITALVGGCASDPHAGDPHYNEAGFFDLHVCNWHDRPLFFLALFSTRQYDEVASVSVYRPDGQVLGELDLKRYKVIEKKDKPEKRVFLTQIPVPDQAGDGWYRAVVTFKDGSRYAAKDFVRIVDMPRAAAVKPAHEAQVAVPEALSWEPVPGAKYYKVYVRDMWRDGKLIHESKLLDEPRMRLPEGLIVPEGAYLWRVHARNSKGDPIYGDFNHGSLTAQATFYTLP